MAITTDNHPASVSGCAACLELVAEDLEDNHEHAGRRLHRRQEVSAPPEGWSGGGWSAGHAHTVAGRAGDGIAAVFDLQVAGPLALQADLCQPCRIRAGGDYPRAPAYQ